MAQAKKSKTSTGSRSRATPAAPASVWVQHRRDLWILGLVVVGLFLGLAEVRLLGPVGHALETGLASTLGLARWLVPVVLIASAIAQLWNKIEVERLRLVLGLVISLVAVSGVTHLAGGQPTLHATTTKLGAAGGWLGVLVGGGLKHIIGLSGALVVLIALMIVAAIFLTGLTLRALLSGTYSLSIRAAKAFGHWWLERPEKEVLTNEPEPALRRRRGDNVPYDDEPPLELESEPATFAHSHVADDDSIDDAPFSQLPMVAKAPKARKSAPVSNSNWVLPNPDLLQRVKEQKHDRSAIDAAGDELVDALAAHGVETTLVGYTVGPTVTRYELELGPGVKVARLTSLHRDIAYAMATPDVRILAPIPGRSAIGVEVPNKNRTLVSLGDLLATEEALNSHHPLDVPLGRDISGRTVVVNLAEMPHLLISGATGAGKSSCINSLLTSLVMRSTPDQLRLILVDPKRVELEQYNDLPHLLSPVVVDPKKAAGALAWAVKEMERRYDLLAEYHVRDITSYHAQIDRGEAVLPASTKKVVAEALERGAGLESDLDESRGPDKLAYIVIVVDELNDLMMVAARDVEDSVVRIAQMARAVGIHLVLATQRPSVDVITGVIKANIPSRMAFAVSSLADSRVILDQAGAERLIGKGDMLLLTASSNVARRLQAPWVSEEEVRRVVSAWRSQGGVTETVVALDARSESTSIMGGAADEDDDVVLAQARELVIRTQLGSTSNLQRKLRVGFARAGRIMDQLEIEGIVGPSEGSKSRRVLVGADELEHYKQAP